MRYAWYVLALFFVAAVLSYTDRLILTVLVDPIRHDTHISDTQISLLQGAAFAVLYSFISLPLGRYADRHNRRNLVIGGIMLWSVAMAISGFAASFTGLFIARIAVGLGEATLAPAVMSMIPDYFPENRRGTAYGIFLTGMAMGSGVAIMAGGGLYAAFQSGWLHHAPILGRLAPWRAVLVALSLPGYVTSVLMLTVHEPARTDTIMGNGTDGNSFRVTVAYLRANARTFGYLLVAFAVANLLIYAVSAWMPSVLIRNFLMQPAIVGATLGPVSLIGNGVGTVLGGMAADWLVSRGGSDRPLRLVFWGSIAALPTLVFPVLTDVRMMLAIFLAFLLVISTILSAGVAAVQNAIPGEMRGFLVAMQAFVYTLLGLGLGPTSVAMITDYVFRNPKAVGLSILIVLVPCMMLIIVLVASALPWYRMTRDNMSVSAADCQMPDPDNGEIA